jgi:glucosamine--fructose-6-phosphate aminotransferase (isomerizing)
LHCTSGGCAQVLTQEREVKLLGALEAIPDQIEKILEDKERLQWFAAKQSNAHDVFFIGRGLDYAVSLEGSLKLKEISYVHSEAYAAGELKHGTISLIEDGTLVISVLTQENLIEKTVSNMVEVKSRGAYLMGLTTYGNYDIEDVADFTTYIPVTDPHFASFSRGDPAPAARILLLGIAWTGRRQAAQPCKERDSGVSITQVVL